MREKTEKALKDAQKLVRETKRAQALVQQRRKAQARLVQKRKRAQERSVRRAQASAQKEKRAQERLARQRNRALAPRQKLLETSARLRKTASDFTNAKKESRRSVDNFARNLRKQEIRVSHTIRSKPKDKFMRTEKSLTQKIAKTVGSFFSSLKKAFTRKQKTVPRRVPKKEAETQSKVTQQRVTRRRTAKRTRSKQFIGGKESIILKTMQDIAKKHPNRSKLVSSWLREPSSMPKKTAHELNQKTYKAIKAANLKPAIGERLAPNVIQYDGGRGTSLTHKINPKTKQVTLEAKGFTGVQVMKRMHNGKLSDKHVDIIEYKDGKAVAVSLATEGKSMVANMDQIKAEVKKTAPEMSRQPKKVDSIAVAVTKQHEVIRTGGQGTIPTPTGRGKQRRSDQGIKR